MADVQPFQGLRFSAAGVPDIGQVLCPPYDVIDAGDDARLREQHPLNVVRLELTTASVAGGADGRYQEAADTLRGWRQDGALVKEAAPAYYLHEATFSVPGRAGEPFTRRELIAAVGVEPWANRAVLPHELTYPRAKADRLRLLAATETNLSPILVFFNRDGKGDGDQGGASDAAVRTDAVDAAWAWAADRAPDAAGTDAEGVGHRLWVLTDPMLVGELRAYFASRPLFIADGHHRYETALNYLEDRRQRAGGELPPTHPARSVMMHLIAEDDPGLVILPLHRLISGIGPDAVGPLVDGMRGTFEIETRPSEPLAAALTALQERGSHGQALALVPRSGDIVLLTRPHGAPFPAAIPADRDVSWQALDVVLLDHTIVRPLLAAHQLHAEDAISYVRDAEEAVRQVQNGTADLAVLVNPTRVEQVAAVALAGERMPEKSTYFFPKAPTGLVFRPLE